MTDTFLLRKGQRKKERRAKMEKPSPQLRQRALRIQMTAGVVEVAVAVVTEVQAALDEEAAVDGGVAVAEGVEVGRVCES